jgi:ribonuclease P protein component
MTLQLANPGDKSRLAVLTRRSEFLAANKGLRVARPGFVLLTRPNDGLGRRFGVTVTKRIGNAVIRNRMKRRFRELLRDALPAEGLVNHDHVLIGREGGVERDFGKLREELSAALLRAATGKGDPPRRPRNGPRAGRRGGKPSKDKLRT